MWNHEFGATHSGWMGQLSNPDTLYFSYLSATMQSEPLYAMQGNYESTNHLVPKYQYHS